MSRFLSRLRGGAALPPAPPARAIALAGLGGFLAIALVAGLAEGLSQALILGSFGASCVLVFGFPEVPFSQPRNVVLGHVLSSFTGLACLALFGPHWWAAAVAVALAIMAMMALRCVHPPAGSNPVLVFLSAPGWPFLITPTGVGALLLVAVALVYNNLRGPGRYPAYW